MALTMTTFEQQQQQSPATPISWWLLLFCIVFVRYFWYEWRPWHALSLKREVVVWSVVWFLYSKLEKRATRQPLLTYGTWALVQQDYADVFYKALEARGLQVAVLVMNDESEGDQKKMSAPSTSFETFPTRITPRQLPTWLGMQQWNGGVGVFVGNSSSIPSAMESVEQHMLFRSSGAILLMNHGGDYTFMSNHSESIVFLEIPHYLESSPSMADAAFKALGYRTRLHLHHVLWQRSKDIFTTTTTTTSEEDQVSLK